MYWIIYIFDNTTLYPATHFTFFGAEIGILENICVPLTKFEVVMHFMAPTAWTEAITYN